MGCDSNDWTAPYDTDVIVVIQRGNCAFVDKVIIPFFYGCLWMSFDVY
jgi:hypothetical protein